MWLVPFAVKGLPLALLIILAILGDTAGRYSTDVHLHAFLDSATHFSIAAVLWICTESNIFLKPLIPDRIVIMKSLCCGLLSSLIDMDHFLQAGSLDLEAALKLSSRPVLHCTTLPLATFIVLQLLGKVPAIHAKLRDIMIEFGWLQLIAIVSHHIRDGYRRGIWLCPLGSIRYPYWCYLILTGLLALFSNILRKSEPKNEKDGQSYGKLIAV